MNIWERDYYKVVKNFKEKAIESERSSFIDDLTDLDTFIRKVLGDDNEYLETILNKLDEIAKNVNNRRVWGE